MAQAADGHVAVLSIHPEFAEAILDGRKTVEFRKAAFKRAVSHVVIYATAPVSLVIGLFEVAGLETSAPAELWRLYHQVGGIDRTRFFQYYDGRDQGVAVKVASARRLPNPMTLAQLREGLIAPQGVVYLDRECLHLLPS